MNYNISNYVTKIKSNATAYINITDTNSDIHLPFDIPKF